MKHGSDAQRANGAKEIQGANPRPSPGRSARRLRLRPHNDYVPPGENHRIHDLNQVIIFQLFSQWEDFNDLKIGKSMKS